jgi:predicted RNA-binding Zn-ribbon protein involved in translation (DUF1610 family)
MYECPEIGHQEITRERPERQLPRPYGPMQEFGEKNSFLVK